jgi:hypothetical protein
MHIYKYISFGLTHAFQADATRRPGHRRKDVHRVPPRFFEDAPYHPHVRHRYLIIVFSDFFCYLYQPSRTHHLSPSSSRQDNITVHPSSRGRTHLGRLSSLFQHNNYNTHDAPPRLRFLEWARSTFVQLPGRNDERVELQERRLAVANVPFTRGKPVSRSFFHFFFFFFPCLLSVGATPYGRHYIQFVFTFLCGFSYW